MKRDGYMCQLSLRNGRRVPADTVHHIFPADMYPEYQWCTWNLISLSHEAHNEMHDRYSGELSSAGEFLRNETAEKMGMNEKKTILVVGNPGTGKTRYVREHMRGGVAYDLDAIAAALRLTTPKQEDCKPARWIANSLLPGFSKAAHVYVKNVYIIRTAPDIDELEMIEPDEIVILYGKYGNAELTDKRRHKIAVRIKKCAEYAKANNIPLKEIDADNR